jgi:hypothetical protein
MGLQPVYLNPYWDSSFSTIIVRDGDDKEDVRQISVTENTILYGSLTT